MKVTTAGDRAGDPASTPFTRFVFAVDQLLIVADRSPSLAACAKRIDRVIASPDKSSFAIARGRRPKKQADLSRDK